MTVESDGGGTGGDAGKNVVYICVPTSKRTCVLDHESAIELAGVYFTYPAADSWSKQERSDTSAKMMRNKKSGIYSMLPRTRFFYEYHSTFSP